MRPETEASLQLEWQAMLEKVGANREVFVTGILIEPIEGVDTRIRIEEGTKTMLALHLPAGLITVKDLSGTYLEVLPADYDHLDIHLRLQGSEDSESYTICLTGEAE